MPLGFRLHGEVFSSEAVKKSAPPIQCTTIFPTMGLLSPFNELPRKEKSPFFATFACSSSIEKCVQSYTVLDKQGAELPV